MMRHDRRRRSQRLRRQLLAGFAFIGLLIGVVALPLASETDAAWVDSEHAVSSMTATQIPVQRGSGYTVCERVGLLGSDNNPAFTVQWKWSTNGTAANVLPRWRVNGEPVTPVTTGPVQGVYTTVFTRVILRDVQPPSTFGTEYLVQASGVLDATNWSSSFRDFGVIETRGLLAPECSIAP